MARVIPITRSNNFSTGFADGKRSHVNNFPTTAFVVTTVQLEPPLLLRSPHLQTLLSSRLVRGLDGAGQALLERSETLLLNCRDGVRLKAVVNADHDEAPLVVLVHGWLGRADSPYVRRASDALHAAGFNVARLLLRDHGGSAGLNMDLFNAARIGEVVDGCNELARRFGHGKTGLMGFSLGGNFALRIAAHPERSKLFGACLAICPVVDPSASVDALDAGWAPYRWYFVRKWRKAFAEKQAAFPDRYDFTPAQQMDRVATLTDFLVEHYTPFTDAREYYSHYTLTAAQLSNIGVPTRILAAADDPVIPLSTLEPLRELDEQVFRLTRRGGHCAFIESYSLRSALEAYTVEYFRQLY